MTPGSLWLPIGSIRGGVAALILLGTAFLADHRGSPVSCLRVMLLGLATIAIAFRWPMPLGTVPADGAGTLF